MKSQELDDEICAIKAIYPECIEEVSDLVYKFKVPQHERVTFQMSFSENYPNSKPSITSVVCSKSYPDYSQNSLRTLFQEVLDSTFEKGCVVIFDLFDELDGILAEEDESEGAAEDNDHWEDGDTEKKDTDELTDKVTSLTLNEAKKPEIKKEPIDPFKGWSISETIKDHKSTFVGFATRVNSVKDVERSFSNLTMDRKIQKANHLMRAYRIKDPKTDAIFEDCEDDGEGMSGSRLMHLLDIMGAWNVYVVVARWYGGIHIGPVRFRHINECARDALVRGQLVNRTTDKKGKKKK